MEYARAAGWSLSDFKCFLPSKMLETGEPFDGYLTIATLEELPAWLKARSAPVVSMLCSQKDLGFPSVEPDCVAIGVRSAEHLLTLGSPLFVFYRAQETPETRRLWEGFSGTLAKAGKKAHLIDFSAGRTIEEVAVPRQRRWDWLRKQIAKLPKPLAILAEDDRFANDIIEVASMLGLRIPEDIALLGIDNRELMLGKLPVDVSSVDSNLHGIGWAAAELLDRIIDGASPPASPIQVKPGQVVVRRSTATFVCDHDGISAAVNYLRAHYHEPIQVDDVARAARLSRRSLQSLFKEVVGCTISEELSRLRLTHAVRLLRETDLKLESIAHESGLRTAKYLCEVFRPAFNLTPTAFRESQRLVRG